MSDTPSSVLWWDLYCDGDRIYGTGDVGEANEWIDADPFQHTAILRTPEEEA